MNNKQNFTMQDFLLQLEQINYLEILDALKPLILYYVSSKALNTYNLHREYKPKNIKKINIPPELTMEYSQASINSLVSTKLIEALKIFTQGMIKFFPQEDLINFYNNVNTLKISNSTFKLKNFILRTSTAGTYDTKKNKITVDENNCSTTIFHELLHMASSTFTNGIRYSGFNQASIKKGLNIGNGLNEGYTELLCRRYFAENTEVTNAYEYQVFTTERLEKIVGKEKMQSLYLNANLPGLIDELKQYSTEEEIMEFIASTDFVLEHLDNKKFKMFEKGMITNSLKNINKFLIKTYSNQLLEKYNKSEINSEQLIEDLAKYVSSLATSVGTGKRKYNVLSNEDLNNYFSAVFGKGIVTINTNSNVEEEQDAPKK